MVTFEKDVPTITTTTKSLVDSDANNKKGLYRLYSQDSGKKECVLLFIEFFNLLWFQNAL